MEYLKVGEYVLHIGESNLNFYKGNCYLIVKIEDEYYYLINEHTDISRMFKDIIYLNFKKVDNQSKRNQEQRPSGGSTHYYELPKNATELSHSIGEIKINDDTMRQLLILGIIEYDNNLVRSSNVGASNYAQHIIQPWSIIQDWELNYWDGDIIKRVLRTKNTDSRKMDYQKIIHICEERIRQIEIETIT